jgi:hypothetical protein
MNCTYYFNFTIRASAIEVRPSGKKEKHEAEQKLSPWVKATR